MAAQQQHAICTVRSANPQFALKHFRAFHPWQNVGFEMTQTDRGGPLPCRNEVAYAHSTRGRIDALSMAHLQYICDKTAASRVALLKHVLIAYERDRYGTVRLTYCRVLPR